MKGSSEGDRMRTRASEGSKQLKFTVPIIVEVDTVGFHAYPPALRGIHMDGDTEEEALRNARDTAADFLSIMVRDGMPIPLSILSQDDARRLPKSQDQKGHRTEEITISLQ